ncbi:MAG: glutaminyl-peptide cyclotransferase [Planctomycetaceae bacterium]
MPAFVLLTAAAAAAISLWAPAGTSAPAAPMIPVRVVNSFLHDRTAFCQGLVVHNGQLLEGTGQYEHSRLRSVDLLTGQPITDIALPDEVFGEGITVWDNTIIQLTWRNGYLITWDAQTFKRTGTVALRQIDPSLTEGWGITHNGTHLIISDGSAVLRLVDPKTFRTVRRLRVKDGFRAIDRLNELEFVNGEILANVWYRDQIARINPDTGRVTGWLDLAPLRPPEVARDREAVLNGIAWDASAKRLFVTGKHWPKLYEITF